jgi:hypothetical protein
MRRVTDCVQLRIVWRGGAVTEPEVGIAVGALTSLARGAEMEARVLDLAQAGTEDAAIAALLTQEGFRSPRHSQVLVNTISAIRRRHRILQAPSHPRRLPGWLTVSQLAQQLGIPRRWIDQRIRSGIIVVSPHSPIKLHLFPDTEATVAGFRSLRAGQVGRLRFGHLAKKQEHQRA